MKTKWVVLVVVFLLCALTVDAQLNKDIKSILDSAMVNAKRFSVNTQGINWDSVQSQMYSRAEGIKDPAGLGDAFGYLIAFLNDHQAKLIHKADNKIIAQHVDYHDAELPGTNLNAIESVFKFEVLENNVRYIRIPSYDNKADLIKEASVLRAAIDTLSKSDSSKWIVDLRGVRGDDFRIHMAGLGPLLGEGLITSVIDKNERIEKMYEIHNGRFYEEQHLAAHFVCPADLSKSNVAVLIDETTAGAGEVLALAFRGRKLTKLFGSQTHGNVGVVKEIDLGGQLALSLTSRYYQDRRGNIYKDVVFPHTKVQQPTGVSEDAVIAAAMQWLVVPAGNAVTASILKKD